MAVGFRLVPGRGLLLLVLLAIGAGMLATAQQDESDLLAVTTAPAYDNADFRIVTRVDEVNLRFTVTDSHGHFQNQLSLLKTVPTKNSVLTEPIALSATHK